MREVIPYLTFKDPRAAIAFYEKALGATKAMVMDGPNGSVMHAEITIGTSQVMLSGEYEGFNMAPTDDTSPVNFTVQVDDCDKAYEHAIASGMTSVSEPQNMFWGDRSGVAKDPFGYRWNFLQHVEDVSIEDMKTRAAEFAKKMGQG